MTNVFRRAEIAITGLVRRKPPQGFVAHSAFWLGLAMAFLLSLRFTHISNGDGSNTLIFFTAIPLTIFAIILLWRWTFRKLLWRVRNRLIVTYLLMGLAPVVPLHDLGRHCLLCLRRSVCHLRCQR